MGKGAFVSSEPLINAGISTMMEAFINTLLGRGDLSGEEAQQAMSLIMSGRATGAQIAGFLVAMRMKGESVEEITGCALAMREAATIIDIGGVDAIDTCGTGGDAKGTFNVSTAAAVVTAAAGIPVAKHGNRSVSSASGSADVLQELGVNIEAPPGVVAECIKKAGIGFLFAPMLHKAMKYAIGPRRELGARTVFNMLGPLTNPAGVRRQVIGLYDGEMLDTIAVVLRNLGCRHAMVVNSHDGMDEISVCAPTRVAELRCGDIDVYTTEPEDFGIGSGHLQDLQVSGAKESADIIRSVFGGRRGPQRDIIALNAGASIYVGGGAQDVAEGVEKASEAISSGAAAERLDMLRECSRARD